MVDVHSHILPGLDDGSSSMEETIRMLEIASKWNIRHIVASSHGNLYDYDIEQYIESFNTLKKEIAERKLSIKIYPGMEIYLDENVPQLLKEKKLIPINNTNYLLVEVPFEATKEDALKMITQVKEMGYRLILAHPERYDFIQNEPSIAWRIVSKGCTLQINCGSLIGEFGENVRITAEQLADMGLVHIVGTDAHDKDVRSYYLGKLLHDMKEKYSDEEIHLWFSENPSRVLKGMELISTKDIK